RRPGHPGLGQVGDGLEPLQLLLEVAGLVGDLLLLLGDGPPVELAGLAVAPFAFLALARGISRLAIALRPLLSLLPLAPGSLSFLVASIALLDFLGLVLLLRLLRAGWVALLPVLGLGRGGPAHAGGDGGVDEVFLLGQLLKSAGDLL